MGGLRTAFAALVAHGPRAQLAERAAAQLGQRLPADYVVLARYAPRDDGSDVVPLVVVGPHGVLVVEPRDEDGALVCYQDHWYRRSGPAGSSHPLAGSPSKRARFNAARVKSDLASGGFIYTPVEGVVVLTRGKAEDVGSSCVPVIVGMDALVRHLESHSQRDTATERTQALVGALSGPIRVATT